MLSTQGYAQTSLTDTTSSAFQSNNIDATFDKNVNTYIWTFRGQFLLDTDGWRISGAERYTTTVIEAAQDRVKDDQQFNFNLERRLSESLDLVTQVNSFIFADTRTSGLNKLQTNKLLGGVRWKPEQMFSLMPLVGYSFDNQQSILDQGIAYGFNATVDGWQFGDNSVFATAEYSAEDLTPRRQDEQNLSAIVRSLFADGSSNQAILGYRSFTRDFYQLGDTISNMNGIVTHPIERRNERLYSIEDQVAFQPYNDLGLSFSANITERLIERTHPRRSENPISPSFDNEIEEFQARAGMHVMYEDYGNRRVEFKATISERNETHTVFDLDGVAEATYERQKKLEEQKNNSISQTQLSVNYLQRVTERDTFSLAFSSLKMQYDTPSDENLDERDELFFLAGLRWMHRFNPYFTASLSGDATMRHTVYIYSERSANNTWNRIFRLTPKTSFHFGDRFSSINTAEVLANYTAYDFESAFPETRSFSFRQLTVTDSTTLLLGRNISATTHLQFRMYERGELKWSEFKIKPTSYFDERTYVLFLTYGRGYSTVSTGVRYFEQTRFSYQGGEKKETNALRSYGPICTVSLRAENGMGMDLDAWYQITEATGSENRADPNVTIRVYWNL